MHVQVRLLLWNIASHCNTIPCIREGQNNLGHFAWKDKVEELVV